MHADYDYDKSFDIRNPGACLTRLAVYVQHGVIVRCVLNGACGGNLRMLACNLTGEKLEDAEKCIDYCCGDASMECMESLKEVLIRHFRDFVTEYEK